MQPVNKNRKKSSQDFEKSENQAALE